jgi:hypothetical protein
MEALGGTDATVEAVLDVSGPSEVAKLSTPNWLRQACFKLGAFSSPNSVLEDVSLVAASATIGPLGEA